MSDAKILQLTPPTPSNEDQPAKSHGDYRSITIDDLLRAGSALSEAVNVIGYMMQDYNQMKGVSALPGIGELLDDIFEKLDVNIEHLE